MAVIEINLTKKTSVIVLLIIALLGSFGYFIYHQYFTSTNEELSLINTNNVSSRVDVYRNYYGIPFIEANNENDYYYTLGYQHAKDRLWQMDFYRRVALGQLSEIFGEDFEETDKLFRALGIREYAKLSQQLANDEILNYLEQYSKGINDFVETNWTKLPFEFGALKYEPRKWTTYDCFLISKLYAFEMSFSYWVDMNFGLISEDLGVKKALSLLPEYDQETPTILDDYTLKPETKEKKDTAISQPISKRKNTEELINLAMAFKQVFNKVGISYPKTGSNSWAVLRNKNDIKSGTILCNDPHLQISLPSKWYQLEAKVGSNNLIGYTLPGIPFHVIGRNNNIAWGITNSMVDDFDFFFEKTKGEDFYFYNGKQEKFKYIKDTLYVRGKGLKEFYLRKNNRSYIISDFNKLFEKKKNKLISKYTLSYSWTASQASTELNSMYRINKASNYKEFQSAVDKWVAPCLNFTYTDTESNIATFSAGLYPKRDSTIMNVPNPGWNSNYEWKGLNKLQDLGDRVNPDNKFVATANNLIKQGNKQITNLYEPKFRIKRIYDLLSQVDEYSSRDAELNQMDVYSEGAFEFLQYIDKYFENNQNYFNNQQKQYYNTLKTWDYFLTTKSKGAFIYKIFLKRLMDNIFKDELGDNYNSYLEITNIPIRKLYEILKKDKDSELIDNINTPYKETKQDIILKSFAEAVNIAIIATNNGNQEANRYGSINKIEIKHFFGENSFLKPSLLLGPFEIYGDNTTIANSEYKYSNYEKVLVSSSMRFICDMKTGDVEMVLPGGSSGEVASPYFSNQVQLWLRGGYLKYKFGKRDLSTYNHILSISR
jgi:penicillin amidase